MYALVTDQDAPATIHMDCIQNTDLVDRYEAVGLLRFAGSYVLYINLDGGYPSSFPIRH